MHNASRLISLDQLRHFVVLSEENHFTHAAKKCNIAQPPFSRSIIKLEKTLGTTLIIRNTRSVALTQAGLVFAKHAKQILKMLDDAVLSVSKTESYAYQLRLGILEYAFAFFGQNFIEEFSLMNLDIQLVPIDSAPEHLTFSVTHGNVELQFAALSERDQLPERLGLREEVIINEPVAALIDAAHPLAKKGKIKIVDLASERLVLFERFRAPDVYRGLKQSFIDHGVRAEIELEVGFFQTMIAAIRATNRVGLIPLSASSLIPPEMKVFPIMDAPHIRLSLVWNESRETKELLTFVQWIIERRSSIVRHHQL